jgi:hypothetical protein
MEQELIAEVESKIDAPVENELANLVVKLEEQRNMKYDLVLPAGSIEYDGVSDMIRILQGNEDTLFKPTELFHDQVSEKLEIPKTYYRRMRSEFPELLEDNVNSWLSKKTKTKYLLRTFKYPGVESVARAMLSNSYNIIDNFDVLTAALEAIDAMGVHIEITKAQVTDKRLYLHVTCPEIQIQADELLKDYRGRSELGVGNGIIAGVCISNSELGLGGYEVCSRATILKCLNGMSDRDGRFRKVHLGAKMDNGVIEWNDSVRQKNYELVIAQTKQAVSTYLSKDYLGQQIKKLEAASGIEIEHPTAVIERVGLELNIAESHRQAILSRFIKGGQTNGVGIFNAFTRQAQEMTPDEQFECEGSIFQMIPRLKSMDTPLSKN